MHGKEEINNVTSYLNEIFSTDLDNSLNTRCYRGHADENWKIVPSVLRGLKSEAESSIISELTLEAPDDFKSDNLMFNKLVRAQHYGAPTRLLDASLNPLVALYFSCREEEEKDACVYVMDFLKKRVKFADSDVVSLISNLARLSDSEKKILSENRKIGEAEFRKLAGLKRLIQFVRVEKPYFLDSVKHNDLFRYYFVYPSKNNKRVIAQSGVFITAGLLEYKGLTSSDGLNVKKIIIKKEFKADMIKELDVLNINSRTMFPEIEFASKYIKDKWGVI
ncbi:FRG domain-containing protein [Pectobacterium punjabense]|uniref:FRG domain-containing protein n=1 Tax=Pectobacterium punjabense TaxID=2108399 RepID=UPI00196972CA|nr:FRG domain-containing protein [Pectobacterium punjabense]MBN3134842.1 FRG domain-containing protein [Pectobacterium punjabense]MCE5382270.1 FRG domain-containing protein [Pectobacterium punjabense]